MMKLLNVIDFFGIGLNFDLSDTMFWLYLAQAVLVFVGIVMFFILLARTRKGKQKVVEKVIVYEEEDEEPVKEIRKEKKSKKQEAKPVVAETAATTAVESQPQPQVIVATSEPQKDEVERVLTGITLDVGVVQREFNVGEEFNCDGMLVRANFNVEPLTETIIAYSVVDNGAYDRLSNVKDIKVCYVLKPDLSEAGIKFVTVKYADQTAIYTVSVVNSEEHSAEPMVVEKIVEVEKPVVVEKIVEVEKVVEKPVMVERVVVKEQPAETVIIDEESIEAGKLRYDKSFTARFIQSDDDVKHWYTQVKNELLSFQKAKARISWKRETFKANKQVVAMLAYRGKTLCLFLPLNPNDYANSKFDVEDASKVPAYAETPALIRLKNDKHVKFALELIGEAMKQKGVDRNVAYVSEDFYLPYEGIVELINKGLVKREIKTAADEAVFERGKQTEDDE